MHLHSSIRSLAVAYVSASSILLQPATPLHIVARVQSKQKFSSVANLVPQTENSMFQPETNRRAFLQTGLQVAGAPSFLWLAAEKRAEAATPFDSSSIRDTKPPPTSPTDLKEQDRKRKAAEKEVARLAEETKKRLAVGRIGTI